MPYGSSEAIEYVANLSQKKLNSAVGKFVSMLDDIIKAF